MKSALNKLMIVVCALHLSGAHWAMLQAMAWTGMLISRVQEAPVAEAVETTFSGDHPCALCLSIQEGKKQEQKKPDAPALPKLGDFKCVALALFELPPAMLVGEQLWPAVVRQESRRREAPPTPPPLV